MARTAHAVDESLTARPVDERAAVQRLLRGVATAGVATMLVVIVSSAYLRLSQAGLSCGDWPACYGRIAPHTEREIGLLVARLAHRIAASAAGIAIIALLLVAATQRPVLKRQTTIAAAALVIAAALASIGAQFSGSGGPPSPLVTLLNLGGGFALLALLWWSRLSASPPSASRAESRASLRGLAALALLAGIAQIALGALVSAKFASLSCPSFPGCGAPWPETGLSSIFDPTQPLQVGPDGAIMRPATLAALVASHRAVALLFAVLAVSLSALLARAGARRIAAVLAVLLATQLALGAAQTLLDLPLALVVAHNLTAALLLCALVSANRHAYASAAPA